MARLLWDGGVCREVLLLSVKTGHSLHMHSVDAAIKHKITEPSDCKKHPKLTAKKVTVVKQPVHNPQTGTFKAKGIDQQKRFNNSPQTPKNQFIRADGVGWTRYTRSSSPNPLRGLCATTRLKNQTHNSVTKENPLQTAEE